jgi:integrase/recombinase XerD
LSFPDDADLDRLRPLPGADFCGKAFLVLETFFSRPKCIERARRSWLRPVIDDFLHHLAAEGYGKKTLRYYSSRLLAFGKFTALQGVSDLSQLPQWIDPFVAQLHGQKHSSRKCHGLLSRLIRHLQRNRVIPEPARPSPTADTTLVEDYLRSLRELRGLARGTEEVRRYQCRILLTYLATEGINHLHALRPDIVLRFIAWQGKRYSRQTLSALCSMLRDFLSFLHRCGTLAADLSRVVVSPRLYRQEQCPRFLTRSEIDAVLAVIDRRTPVGQRDYAMILLLATYGLRGSEVVRLCLDDIDWRNQLLQIQRRKAGNRTIYPLSVSVGEAIIAYLQQVRPASPHREVFLKMVAPFAPLASCSGLTIQVKRYLTRAGICVARPGTHTFRYSCAQRLFEQDMPLKSIGDYLGHQFPGTTERYTQIDLERLREVAAGDVEDLL